MRSASAKALAFALLVTALNGCAARRPCTEGGDFSGLPPFTGDVLCFQRDYASGAVVNHGRFVAYGPGGEVSFEGQFTDGRRTGVWTFYDEKGKKSAERTYNQDGVEISGTPGSAPGGSPPAGVSGPTGAR